MLLLLGAANAASIIAYNREGVPHQEVARLMRTAPTAISPLYDQVNGQGMQGIEDPSIDFASDDGLSNHSACPEGGAHRIAILLTGEVRATDGRGNNYTAGLCNLWKEWRVFANKRNADIYAFFSLRGDHVQEQAIVSTCLRPTKVRYITDLEVVDSIQKMGGIGQKDGSTFFSQEQARGATRFVPNEFYKRFRVAELLPQGRCLDRGIIVARPDLAFMHFRENFDSFGADEVSVLSTEWNIGGHLSTNVSQLCPISIDDNVLIGSHAAVSLVLNSFPRLMKSWIPYWEKKTGYRRWRENNNKKPMDGEFYLNAEGIFGMSLRELNLRCRQSVSDFRTICRPPDYQNCAKDFTELLEMALKSKQDQQSDV